MRPIKIVPTPVDSNTGVEKVVVDYALWKQDLIDSYGKHCFYCNRNMMGYIAAEHIQPQCSEFDPLIFTNLVLSCLNCNSIKQAEPYSESDYYWPHLNNTMMLFKYVDEPHPRLKGKNACVPKVKDGLNEYQKSKAAKTIKLTGLDIIFRDNNHTAKAADLRWEERYEAHLAIKKERDDWDTRDDNESKVLFLGSLAGKVNIYGFFPLWFEAFKDIPVALKMIVSAIKGTDESCLIDNQGNLDLKGRNPTNSIDTI